MARLSGPALEKLVDRLENWYAQRRQELIAALEDDYPYGAVKLDPMEQYNRFLEMMPEDYEALINRLNDQYRGLPDQYNRVNKDLADYMAHMVGVMIEAVGE